MLLGISIEIIIIIKYVSLLFNCFCVGLNNWNAFVYVVSNMEHMDIRHPILDQMWEKNMHFLVQRTGADAIKKFIPSLGIPF